MVVVFAVLLLACIAAPVFADSTQGSASEPLATPEAEAPEHEGVEGKEAPKGEGESGRSGDAPAEEAAAEPPDEEEPHEGLEREAGLETPKAEEEREASQYAYTNLAPSQEEKLLEEEFAPQLEAIDADPSRALSEVALDEVTSPTEALVTLEGEKVLLESSTPLRAPGADGKLSKVDLGLEETSGGYSPANPLVEVSLPKGANEPIGIGESGLAITAQGGSPDSTSRLLDQEDLFLPEAEKDTSLLLSPISDGLEFSAMLASRESPEQLAFAVALPAGAELRASEDGGAEVLGAEGDVLYRITAPKAVDGQGTSIPVKLEVNGDSVVLEIAHREMEIAYPLYLDPEVIEENQSGFADPSKLNYWSWQSGGPTGFEFIGQRSPIVDNWGNGLYIRSRASITYGAGSFGRWWFSPPGSTTYFHRVIFGPLHYDAHGCAANEPHGYAGIWNNGGFWSALVTAYPSGWGTGFDNGSGNFGAGARTAFIGMEAAGNTNIKCGHDYALNGATFYLDDPETPNVSPPSGVPAKWVNLTTPFTIFVPVSDPGLGVKSAKLSPAGFAEHSQELSCSGLVANPCPASRNFEFSLSGASFSEGETSARISAKDALEKTSNTEEVKLKVDNTPPELRLEGQLAKATDEEGGKKAEEEDPTKFDALSLPVYNLAINATDGSNESAATKRSGVKSIEVFLDKSEVPVKTWTEPSCPASSCRLNGTYTLKLNELSAETHHTLRIVARDFAENKPREREITFEYIPATGMKEEYVLQYFPLPDGQGIETEEEETPAPPELAVNAVNGNLVFRQQDVNVEGPAADLEVERYYNSLLPSSQNTEWGDGWTLAQTPTLEADKPESGPPIEATVVEESGAVASSVSLPTTVGEPRFNKHLQAVITKEPSGGYALTDESVEGEGTLAFNESGEATELRTTEFAGIQYSYASGHLAGIAVNDPASAGGITPSQPPELLVSPTPTYSSAFGSSGTGNGQFAHPGDIAIDPKGNLWIADEENNRLQEFNEKGEFLKAVGSKGAGNGQFNRPKSIAFAANGNFWVADSGNNRLQEFSEAGTFLKAVGSSGSGNGQLNGPEGLAIDPKGNIWVADTYNFRVQELNAAGEFVKVVNPTGLGAIEPTGLDVGPGANVWVADWAHNRIVELSESGGLVRSFGSEGVGNGQFNRPDSVTVDTKGDVFVGDQNNGRVQEFNQSGGYVTQFGTKGAGTGQFSFGYPTGIAADSKGDIWVTDTGNNRIQKWAIPSYAPTYSSAFGSSGTGNGQFAHPADVAIDPKGHRWVADENNNRIEEFAVAGEYMATVGSAGAGNGQFNRPKSIVFAANGNFWVADSGNNRLQEFSEAGTFLKAVGSSGSGNGQLSGPESIAIDAKGNIWVADTYNYRVQELNEKGEFVKVVNPTGLGAIEPTGLDVGPGANVWVADWAHNRIVELSESGGLVRSFGSAGAGNGQFNRPDAVTVDSAGGVWVGDQNNERVQEFNQSGEYVTQFGSSGSGNGQFSFSYPLGIAADNNGGLWISDTNNNRVQRWSTPLSSLEKWETEVAAEIENPSVDVNVASGLVQSVKGKEVGEVSYHHSGESLTGVSAPEGESTYQYDGAGRMTKVTLPHGTYAEIAYEPTYGRVSSVTVSIEGAKAKTTHFEYTDEPRRTKVVPDGEVATTYEVGAEGSVFKWSNAKQPPVFDSIAGTLHDPEDLETANPISVGAHNLIVQAHANEGIASIQVIVGDQVVTEVKCEKSRTECETEKLQWVTETGDWPPGIVYLEVIATDQIGQMASERFWVNVPYAPPSEAETPQPAKFSEILKFREEYGLDLDLKGNESAIDERIFDLMGDWNNPNTPAGEVARASWERWGVPLRVVDIAELEYRDWFYNLDAERIERWVTETEPSSFAGYYIDHAAGGLMYIGFLDNQAERLASLKASLPLVAGERLRVYSVTPTASYLSVQSASESVSEAIESNSTLSELVLNVEDDEAGRAVRVGTQNVAQVESILHQILGSNVPIAVEYEAGSGEPLSGRFRNEGRVRAGDFITTRVFVEGKPIGAPKEHVANRDCTAGFGAKSKDGEARGHAVWSLFVLTAGHCNQGLIEPVYRSTDTDSKNEDNWKKVGTVTRRGLGWSERVLTDAEAIEVDSPGIVPQAILSNGGNLIFTKPAAKTRKGKVVCYSGAKSQVAACGVVVGRTKGWTPGGDQEKRGGYWVKFTEPPIRGDSGAPVWDIFSNASIGLVTAKRVENGVNETLVEPLLHPSHMPSTAVPGILKNSHMRPLSLKFRR